MSKLIMRQTETLRAALSGKSTGQIIILLALAMIGLLVAGGIAVDTGVIFLRRAQLARSVDAAALAGVVEMYDSGVGTDAQALELANDRGTQLLAANGILLTQAPVACASVDWNVDEYCGTRSDGDVPGSIQYSVVARWEAETYFMHLVGFNQLPLWASATAQYLPLVDIYASDTSEYGYVRASNQSLFGPGSCSNYGDPYSTTVEPDGSFAYQYRIRIPDEYLDDWSSSGYTGDPRVSVQIFDPDTGNYLSDFVDTFHPETRVVSINTQTPSEMRDSKDAALIRFGDVAYDDRMPFWLVRVDENRRDTGCSEYPNNDDYHGEDNTRTIYRLYYYEELSNGTLREVDLAVYVGKADYSGSLSYNNTLNPSTIYANGGQEAQATDLNWVTPGAGAADRMPVFNDIATASNNGSYHLQSPVEPETFTEPLDLFYANYPADWHGDEYSTISDGDFIVNLATDIPNIAMQEGSGIRDLYLEVRSIAGGSENGYELWAGPPRSADPGDYLFTVPTNVNSRMYYMRQQHLLNNDGLHNSNGVGVFGIGHLPMNANIRERIELPLAYVGPQFAGQLFTIRVWDADGTFENRPTVFYFDTISPADWTACFANNNTSSASDCTSWGTGSQFHRYNSSSPDEIYRDWYTKSLANAWNYYRFYIPSEGNPDPINDVPFYGGRLFVSYAGDGNDTIVWDLIVDARPVLIQ